ncbi:ATP-binding cassette domain-containing protein [Cesiribacter sp. SM1]|uniref:ABC transporter ATP-binding protein n=1 Tax=Cesiribacter sp. SM1 TaxID=2861196 RepID=UPI001CD3EC7B|nr:ATP-binding cassette domain-containing protein [Cesiribacter sp. SM1]
MITLSAHQLGKRYIRQWIFRKLDYTFRFGEPCAVTGPNGSGKSTLLRVLSQFQPPTEGKLMLQYQGKTITADNAFRYISVAAPYLDLIEDFSLAELLRFHFSFKQSSNKLSLADIADRMYLKESLNKPVKHFSSGMKQRLKLGLAFYADTPLLFLDEPTTNLDEQGQQWYRQEVEQVLAHKLVLIASNQPSEYSFCTTSLHLPDWKGL